MATIDSSSSSSSNVPVLSLASELAAVAADIKETKEKIDKIEKQLETCPAEDKQYLRDEKKQLQDKEKQLRDKENKLLDKEMLLLQQHHQSQSQRTVGTVDNLLLKKMEEMELQQKRAADEQKRAADEQKREQKRAADEQKRAADEQKRAADEQKRSLEQLQQQLQPIQQDIHALQQQQIPQLTSPSDSIRGERLWNLCPNKRDMRAGFSDEFLTQAAKSAAAAKLLLQCGSVDQVKARCIIDALSIKDLQAQFPENKNYLEVELVAYLTPYLTFVVAALPDEEQRLVNSEKLGWIRTESQDPQTWRQPDLFICHLSAFVPGKEPTGESASAEEAKRIRQRQQSVHADTTYHFGRCEWKLRDSVECTLEGKRRSMSLHSALHECHAKAQYLLANHRDAGHHTIHADRKCVLFDEKEVLLLRFSSTGLLSSLQFCWDTPGSFLALLTFLHSPVEPGWLSVLKAATRQMQLQLSPTSDGPFLGEGGTAKVFRVKQLPLAIGSSSGGSSGGELALKIVDNVHHHGLSVTTLQHEVDQVNALARRSLPVNARNVLPSCVNPHFKIFSSDVGPGTLGAAALFSPVGKCVARADRSKSLWLEVSGVLALLHQHGILHGDPRLANLIRVTTDEPRMGASSTRASDSTSNSRLVWIDFRSAGHIDFANDCRICLESFFVIFDSQVERSNRLRSLASRYQAIITDAVTDAQQQSDSGPVEPLPSPLSLAPLLVPWCEDVWRQLSTNA